MAINIRAAGEGRLKGLGWGLYSRRRDILILLLILVFAFAVRYITLMDMGITWDEPTYVHAGITYVNNILHLNFDSSAYMENLEHPPVAKYLYGMAIWIFNGGSDNYQAFVVARTLSATLGAATCGLVFLIGLEFIDAKTGFISAIILALIPDFVAHTQIAALDGPLAFFFTLTMYLFMKALKTENKGYYVASAISLGLLVDTKFNGLLILPVMASLFLLHKYLGRKEKNISLTAIARTYLPLGHILGYFLIAVVTAFLIYPWAWGGFDNIRLTLQHWTYVPTEYFLGINGPAPLGYYPIYFMATTPALLFLPLALGVFFVLRSRDPFKYAALLWLILPFIYDLSSFKQGGMRYLLMIYPALALLCGMGLTTASAWVARAMKDRRYKDMAFIALSMITVVYLIATLISISPYYLDYYNGLVGGLPNVYEHKMFDVGWWGEGIYDSARYIENTAPPNSSIYVAAMPPYLVNYYGFNETYITPNSEGANIYYGVDYLLTNTYSDWFIKPGYDPGDYQLVYATKVQGVPLASVYKRVA
jgi:4-amino-4-deoxy-L-arabinose transferase-like glycosyltransferase